MVLYLVLSHANPTQVLRLVRRLAAAPAAAVLIHHDPSKAPLDDRALAQLPGVERVPAPIPVRWGSFDQVRAVLAGLDHALARGIPFDWVVLLSGQDYPCVALEGLEPSLAGGGWDGFIDHEPLERRQAENVERAYFRYYALPVRWRAAVARLRRLNELQPWLRLYASRIGAFAGVRDRRPFSAELPFRRGSFWWALSRPCVEYVHRFCAERPDVVRAFERKLHPDESFVQTVLVAAGRFRLANDDLRYLRWDNPLGGSPAVLRAADVPEILASGKPFARKLDARIDPGVMDALDAAAAVPCEHAWNRAASDTRT